MNVANKLWLVLFTLICSYQSVLAQKYSINGNVTGFRNNTRVYLKDNESESQLDSTVIKQGKFYLKGILHDAPKYVNLVIHEPDKDYECTLFAGAGKVFVKGDKKDFPYNVKTTGSIEQTKFNNYQQFLKTLNTKADIAYAAYIKAQGDSIATRKAGMAYNAIANKLTPLKKKWFDNNPNTYLTASQLYDYLPQLNKDTIQQWYASLPNPIKQSIYGKRIKTYLTIGDTLKVNDRYTDFDAFDISGKKQKLSDFNGKYILLDFSTKYCTPCKQSTAELKSLSEKYRDKLTLITFTPDNHADWQQSIIDDKVTWISLSDGDGNYSKVLLKYNVQAYPTFYLISPDGKVADKWIGYDKSEPGEIEKHLIHEMSSN